MKKYPPRKHDKSKRVSKADIPKWILHRAGFRERPTVWRPIKGLLIRSF